MTKLYISCEDIMEVGRHIASFIDEIAEGVTDFEKVGDKIEFYGKDIEGDDFILTEDFDIVLSEIEERNKYKM